MPLAALALLFAGAAAQAPPSIPDIDIIGAQGGQTPSPDAMILESALAGAAARPRLASAERRPPLVARNAIVSMQYESGALVITTAGRALGPGGDGDIIRVMNVASKVAVPATVVGPNLVRVSR